MAVCDFCNQEMTVSASCTWKPVLEVKGDAQERLSYPPNGDTTYPVECRDCGTPQGGLHHPGCHAERCPACGGQAISCDCAHGRSEMAGTTNEEIVDRVAWALHAWTCPLCHLNGFEAMAHSGQDHVTSDTRMQAHFLVGALGLTADPAEEIRSV